MSRSVLLAALTGAVLHACAGQGAEYVSADRGELPVVDTARVLGGCDRFAEVVAETELRDLLASEGPFTVFVPSDEAFLTLQADRRHRALLANPVRLRALLRRHVVASDLRAATLVTQDGIRTLDGEVLRVEIEDGQVLIDGASVLSGDYEASNGVVHLVDQLLLPEVDPAASALR